MHKNTVNKTATAYANVAASNNGSNIKKAYINILATVDNARRARPRWQPAAIVAMSGECALTSGNRRWKQCQESVCQRSGHRRCHRDGQEENKEESRCQRSGNRQQASQEKSRWQYQESRCQRSGNC